MSLSGVVSRCQPNHKQPVFVIGVTERGVTVRSQQRRAINLIDALLMEGRLCAGSRIAIIGAGAAGLTAAVRAAQAGIRAHVLERQTEILATFRGNHNRLLHPNLYAWPAPNWLNPDAELPVMTWSAAPAGRVAATLENQFRDAISRTGLITCTTSAVVHWPKGRQSLGRRGSLLELAWRDRAGEHAEAVSVVILAVGFGREPRTGPGTSFPGYWDNDPLDQTSERRTVLIQGTGDGGLTDALRLRLRGFDQASTFAELLIGDHHQWLADGHRLAVRVAEIEALEAVEMDAAYRALQVAWLDDAIRAHGFRPHDVTLVGISPTFGPGRFPLNKLFVSRLQLMKELRIVELPPDQKDFTVESPDARGVLPPVDLGDGAESFDVALIRIGKGNALKTFGKAIANGATAMVSVDGSIDGASISPMPGPPPATSLSALAVALDRSNRLLDVVETLLMHLQHGRPGDEIAAKFPFEYVRDKIEGDLRGFGAVAVGNAPGVVAFIRERLMRAVPFEAEVIVRALAEAIDHHYGDRLLRSLRGPFGRRASLDVGPCSLSPRGLIPEDPRGRRDNGLSRVALLPGGTTTARIEWTRRAWQPDAPVAGVRVFASIEDLEMTGQSFDSTMHFFGATIRDRGQHRQVLDDIVERIHDTQPDFLLFSEFALQDHEGWAGKLHRATGVCILGGVGHVRRDMFHRHEQIAVLTRDEPSRLLKSAASVYVRESQAWREDIHVASPRVFVMISGDGSQLALVAGEDLPTWPAEAVRLFGARQLLLIGGQLGVEIERAVEPYVAAGIHCILVGFDEVRRRSPS